MQQILTGLVALLISTGALAQSDTETIMRARTDAAIADGLTPGLSASLLLADGTRIDHQAGLTDQRNNAPVEPETRFLSGSVGKTITALVAVQLADEGVLNLDAPVEPWLSGRDWWPALANHDGMTLRHLLNHSAGVPDYLEDLDFFLAGLTRGQRGFTPDETVGFIAGDDAEGPLGQHFSYSDTDYILVGLVIEAATGEAFYDLAQSRVIAPLGLSQTEPLQGRDFARLANGHQRGWFGLSPTARSGRLRRNLDHEWTAGGWVTTPQDLVALYRALGAGGMFEAEGRTMRADYNAFEPGGAAGYGLGLYVRVTGEGTYRISHGGDFGGYRSAVLHDSATGLTVASQANAKPFEAPDFNYGLWQAVSQ
ncbi:serine hydrolase domain-containing protein [Maricaulis maris]|uniref:D-alanyl-D-alanine carboxypeptidase n=1 Tax=Maricaulis maris TaxID=74318 RepID=A0A495D1G5_9PROT|nr:serine hydrolase domain-containing protein [Maricaulis maris]RKQ95336.1 D-alanyl-D-alanine carboxypeptidase [Maricaulis maris]